MSEEFRRVYLPYCVKKMNDSIGGWIVLNRHYKPLGMSNKWIDYKQVAAELRIKRIPLPQLKKLWHGNEYASEFKPKEMVWLYHDACIPSHSSASWREYEKRLAILARLELFMDYQPHSCWPDPFEKDESSFPQQRL